MKEHGQKLIQILGLLKMTLGRSASAVIGVVHTVNDPESVLKQFISEQLTTPALSCNISSTDDITLPGISIYADDKAIQMPDNPPALQRVHGCLNSVTWLKGARRNECRKHYSGSTQRLPLGDKSWLTLRNTQSTCQLRLAALLDTEEKPAAYASQLEDLRERLAVLEWQINCAARDGLYAHQIVLESCVTSATENFMSEHGDALTDALAPFFALHTGLRRQ